MEYPSKHTYIQVMLKCPNKEDVIGKAHISAILTPTCQEQFRPPSFMWDYCFTVSPQNLIEKDKALGLAMDAMSCVLAGKTDHAMLREAMLAIVNASSKFHNVMDWAEISSRDE